jgi:hypothetical protein
MWLARLKVRHSQVRAFAGHACCLLIKAGSSQAVAETARGALVVFASALILAAWRRRAHGASFAAAAI